MGQSHRWSVDQAIGRTPLIRLGRVSELTGCEILAKAEFMNPGGSVKDRAALALVRDAERGGLLRPGGYVVEGTAGNTGIGIALVANAQGYRTVIVMPDSQSAEKRDILRALGAELHLVPPTDHDDPDNYRQVARRLAAELARETGEGAVWLNQFDNLANRQGHFETTGPEIWEQCEGRVDAFICSVGTGGTLAGVSRFLKEADPRVQVGLADPCGAAMFSYFTTGTLEHEGSSIIEGIGLRWLTANLAGTEVDYAVTVPDAEALETLYSLAASEGLLVGLSFGVNVAGAIRMARRLGPGHRIVTILSDSGTRYLEKLSDIALLEANRLPPPAWLRSGREEGEAILRKDEGRW